MGIESFFGGYIKRNYQKCLEKQLPKRVSSLFVDCNGIFHNCAQKVYGYGEYEGAGLPKKNNEEIIRQIEFKLEEILKVCTPENNFILAPDGVATAAKMNQQKSRRFLSAAARTSSFDSNQFTPGTELMIRMDAKIRRWLNMNKTILPKKVIYSSHLDDGEGEHKIFEFIRRDKLLKGEGAHILYGLDSDLIILSLLCELPNIYLMREDYRSLVNIDKLRELVKDKFRFDGADETRIIKDFSVICMFAGNDFLPKLPSYTDIGNFLEIFRRLYVNGKKHLIDENNDIDFKVMYNIFKKFSDVEDKLLVKIVKENIHKYPYPELIECVKDNKLNSQKFTNLWYCKQFCPATGELASLYEDNSYYTEADIGKMVIEFLKTFQWVYKYYTTGFRSVSNTHFYPFIYAPFGKSIFSILDQVFKDKRRLKTRLTKLRDVGNAQNIDITALHQLLSVIPRRSIKIIPPEGMDLYENFMTLVSPENFIIKHEGTNTEWHRTALIPPVNMNLVSYAINHNRKFAIPERLQNTKPVEFINTQYVPKRRQEPFKVKRNMDKFVKTTDYKIKDVQLI